MAVASVLVLHHPQDQQRLLEILGDLPAVVEIAPVGPDKIAATLDYPSQALTGLLTEMATIPDVLDLELIFANYEDDLDEEGYIPAPPEAKKYD